MKGSKRKLIVFGIVFVLILTSFAAMLIVNEYPSGSSKEGLEKMDINELSSDSNREIIESPEVASVFLGEFPTFELGEIITTFEHVFSELRDEVTVYPSENYLYFRFKMDEKYIWGNIRLAPKERDNGFLHFAYYEFSEELTGPDEANIKYKLLGPGDGISIDKINDFCYTVSFKNKNVKFNLTLLHY